MAKMEFEVTDVHNVERTLNAIRRGFVDGMEAAASSVIDSGKEAAKDEILQNRRLWTYELYSAWLPADVDVDRDSLEVHAEVSNPSPHAQVIDEGRRPGERAPQVQHIIEWVDDKIMAGYSPPSVDEDTGGGDDPDPMPDFDYKTDTDDEDGDGDTEEYTEAYPTTLRGHNSPEDLEEHGADPSWTFYNQGHNPLPHRAVYSSEQVIVYNESEQVYYGGEVVNIHNPERITVELVGVERPDGSYHTVTVQADGTYSPTEWSLVAHADDWDDLSESEQWNVVRHTFAQIQQEPELITNMGFRDEIDTVIDEYIEQFRDPLLARYMGESIQRFTPEYNRPYSNAVPSAEREAVSIKLTSSAGLPTIRHELAHAFVLSRGYHYSSDARRKHNDWNTIDYFRANSQEVPFNYVEQGGPSAWDWDDAKRVPHPKTYFLKPEAASRDEHAPFDEWGQSLYEQIITYNLEDDSYESVDQGYEMDILSPTHGMLQEGDYLRLKLELKQETITDEFKVVRTFYDNPETGEVAFDVEYPAKGKVITLHTNNWLMEPWADLVGYKSKDDAGGSLADPSVDPANLTPDPGLTSSDPFERWTESLARANLRGMIAHETLTWDQRERFNIGSSYSLTNGQETAAKTLELLLATQGGRRMENPGVVGADLYRESPELLYTTWQLFEIPHSVRRDIESELGKEWAEIISELRDKFGP